MIGSKRVVLLTVASTNIFLVAAAAVLNVIGPSSLKIKDHVTTSTLVLLVIFIVFILLYRKSDLKISHRLISSLALIKIALHPSFLFIVVPVLVTGYYEYQIPLFGWDALDQWGAVAIDYARAYTDSDDTWKWGSDKTAHPATISAMMAFFGFTDVTTSSLEPSRLLWIYTYISLLFLVFIHSLIVTGRYLQSAVITFIVSSVPLYLNHALIFGYAELFLTSLLVSCALIFIHARDSIYLHLGIAALSLTLAATKNIGIFFSLAFIVSLVFYRLQPRGALSVKTFLLITPLCGLAFVKLCAFLDIELWPVMRNRELLLINFDNIYEIPRNELFSLFINVSFSLSPWVIFTGFAIFFTQRQNEKGIYFLSCLTFISFLLLLFSQLTFYGQFYATPGNDTGNSRFTIPVIITGLLLMPYIIMKAENRVIVEESPVLV